MADYFFDSSTLVKRYIAETGTAWVTGLVIPASGNRIYIAVIAGAETIAAITRRLRRGEITASDAKAAMTKFRRDFAGRYSRTQITLLLINHAMDLAGRHGLRGYDAVQLAAALQVQTERLSAGVPGLTFVSADNELNAAALAEGLMVDNPNAHP